MTELWCPFAIRLDGPASKVGYQDEAGNRILETHDKVGIDYHTMEYESTPEWNDAKTLYNALHSGREASWILSICSMFGAAWLYQHYPLNAVTWAQGYLGNLWLIGIETESKDKHKFTPAEYALLVKVSKWIGQNLGWKWRGIGNRQTKLTYGVNGWLFEHNATPLAPGTDCAVFTHGQVDPERLLRDLREEDMQTPFIIGGHTYVLTETGFLHVHDNKEQARLARMGYDFGKSVVLQADDPVLDHCPVTYQEIPGPMR